MLHSEGAMENDKDKNAKKAVPRGLISHAFTWSIKDILNKNLYKNKVIHLTNFSFSDLLVIYVLTSDQALQVRNILMTFSSLSEDQNSFGQL